MDEKDFEDFDEEEFEMLINGLIHPGDMFVSPDFMGGAFPPPIAWLILCLIALGLVIPARKL